MPGAHPYSLRNTLVNPLARMLPLKSSQRQVYRLGEKNPPVGGLENHSPSWEVVSFVLAANATSQARISLQRDFTLLALACAGSVTDHGSFRAQFYDTKKKVRFADRGVLSALIAGAGTVIGAMTSPFFLREPYAFDEPDSQMLVLVQNLEPVVNTIQIAFYGQVLRFNQPSSSRAEFPGGSVSNAWGD